MRGRPVTPPGGLNIGSYDKHLKETKEQKKKDYKEMLDQVRPLTPHLCLFINTHLCQSDNTCENGLYRITDVYQ